LAEQEQKIEGIDRLVEQASRKERYCMVCGEETKNFCMHDICEKCCELMKCDKRYACISYPMMLEEIIKELNRPRISKTEIEKNIVILEGSGMEVKQVER